MIAFSQCGYFEGRVGPAGPTLNQCPHPASFTGAGPDDTVAVACFSHHHLLKHPTAIHGLGPVDGETLARVAENQAAMEQLLDSGGT